MPKKKKAPVPPAPAPPATRLQVPRRSLRTPYTIVLRVAGFRVEAAGPISYSKQTRDLSVEEFGSWSPGDGVFRPFTEGEESYTSARYAILTEEGREIAARTAVGVYSSGWMGTWGGGSTTNTYAVIDGRPAERFAGARAWIPAAEPPPEHVAFDTCELPVAAIMEFQKTEVPPAGWTWDPDSRVLSRSIP